MLSVRVMDKTVTEINTYTAIELAELRLPGFPASRKNWYELVAREQWAVIEKPGKGPGGVRREYVPPPEVQAMIDAVLRGETPPVRERRKQSASRPERVSTPVNDRRLALRSLDMKKTVNSPKDSAQGVIDFLLLNRCFMACSKVYGVGFDKVPVSLQLQFTVDFYNALIGMAANMKGGVGAFQQLETHALVEQLRLLLQMEVVKPWCEGHDPFRDWVI